VSELPTHERAFELLPWLVNGSLPAEERDLVEQHVRNCLSCHRELKEQQRLRAALRSQPAIHVSAQTGFDRLTRDLSTSPERIASRARPFAAFARFAVVAAAGGALLGALLWLLPLRDDRYAPTFETLATQPTATSVPAIDVIFVQSVTAAEIQRLLEEIDGSIAAGPTDVGRYTVRLDGARNADVDALLARLQRDPRVRFAGASLAAAPAP
jgi:hypothetical protein